MAKTFVSIVLISITLFCIAQIDSYYVAHRRNDLILGTLRPGNVLVRSEIVNKTGVRGHTQSQNFTYSGFRNITRVRAMDLNQNGTGGYASVVYGGPGYKNVTLHLVGSAPGRPLNFNIDVNAL